MKNTLLKRFLSLALTLCMVLSMCPVTAFAAEGDAYAVGDTVSNTTGEEPAAVEGAVWVESSETNTVCEYLIEHTHNENCYYKSCDHKDGHLSTCYSESTTYELCTHTDNSEHSGTVTISDVVKRSGLTLSWNTAHPAYDAVYAYYNSLSGADKLKILAAKFCYTVSTSAEPDLCTHTCSGLGGGCYTKLCMLTEHTHTETCYKTTYTWTLYADVNGNVVADTLDTYYVVYKDGETTLYTSDALAYGAATPTITEPESAEGYVFAGWEPEVAETVTTPAVGTTITYNATWKPDVDENGDGKPDGQQSCTASFDTKSASILEDECINGMPGSANPVPVNKEITITATIPEGYYVDADGVTIITMPDKEAFEEFQTAVDGNTLTITFKTGYDKFYVISVDVEPKLDTQIVVPEDITIGYAGEALTAEDILKQVAVSVVSGENVVTNEVEIVTASLLGVEYTIQKWSDTLNEWVPAGTSIGGDNITLGDLEDTYKITVSYAGDEKHNAAENKNIVFELVDDRADAALTLQDNTIEIKTTADVPVTEEEILEALFVSARIGEEEIEDPDLSVSYIAKYDESTEAYIPVYSSLLNVGSKELSEYGKYEVKVALAESSTYDAASETAYLTIVDARIATEITLAEGVTIPYSEDLTEETIFQAVDAMLTAEGKEIEGELTYEITGINAGTQTVTVKFEGDEQYAASSAEVEVTIEKADASIKVGSANVKYPATVSVSGLITNDPAAAERIEFTVGLNLGANASANAGAVAYVNLPEIVDLDSIDNEIVKNAVGKVLNQLSSGSTMTVSQLKTALEGVLSGMEAVEDMGVLDQFGINLDTQSTAMLISVLEQIEDLEGIDSLTVYLTIGDEIVLKDAGVYLIGGVISDANYNTAYGLNYAIISPDGYKADLEWKIEDENGFVTLDAIRGDYDLGAYVASVNEGNIEGAEAHLVNLFIGVDMNGNATLTTSQSELAIGAYTEIAFIRDLGNTMYYAEPLVRPVMVVSDLVEVKFIDENGNVNHERLFTYDGEPHGMTAVVYDRQGNELAAEEQARITYRYIGAESDGEVYYSAEAPSASGTYTVIATYKNQDEDPTVVGMAIGALVIQPMEASISVDDVTHVYDGNAVNVLDLIHKTPDDAKMVTIVAGIGDMGDFSEDGLSAVEGVVYVDFPARVDEVLKQLNASLSNINVSQFLSLADQIKAAMEQAGLDTAILDQTLVTLGALSENVTLEILDFETSTKQNPVNIGAYLVIAGIMDPDYMPVMDRGLILITPELTEYVLEWNYEDANGILTRPILSEVNMGASAMADGEADAEVTAQIQYYLFGVDEEGSTVTRTGLDYSDLPNGVYTQVAYIETELDANMTVAAPIVRTFMVVHQSVTVTVADLEVDYDGNAHSVDVEATYATTGEAVKAENLAVTYVGVDASAGLYNSTTAPTNAGVYAVTAVYAEYDGEELMYFGADVGSLIIKPAVPAFSVEDTTVTYDGEEKFAEIVNDNGLEYIAVVVDAENNVNIILPESWNIDTIDVTGGVEAVLAKLEELQSDVPAELTGYYGEALAELKDVLAQISEELSINSLVINGEKPVEIGQYQIMAIAFGDANYEIAVDEGTLVIEEAKTPDEDEDKDEWEEGDGYPIYFTPGDANGLIKTGATVYVDDVAYVLDENCIAWAEDDQRELAVGYVYKLSGDHTTSYSYADAPTHMYIWDLQYNAEKHEYQAVRVKALDDVLSFAGGSIWLNSYGANGIRFYYNFTGYTTEARLALKEMDYRIIEHGTVLDWEKNIGSSQPILRGDRSNSATGKSEGNRLYQNSVYPLRDEYITPNMRVRFYMILQNYKTGETTTIYSGSVQRSIGYIAWQNRTTYQNSSAEFHGYVWDIIDKANSLGASYK